MDDSERRDRRDLTTAEMFEHLQAARREHLDENRPAAVESQHEQGKLTARERIDYLLDAGTFEEIGRLAAPAPSTPETQDWDRDDAPFDGIVAGFGEVDGRPVAVVATDFTIKGGSIGHTGGKKLRRTADQAVRRGVPFLMLHDGGGHRIQEGLDARTFAHAGDFMFQTKASGWVPQVSAMMGPGFAAATNYAAGCDFVPIVEGTATMGVAGPALVEAALGKEFTKQELGSAQFQTSETGMADLACADDEACLDAVKRYLSYLPTNASEDPPVERTDPPHEEDRERLRTIIPNDTRKGYDIHEVLAGIVDQDSVFEVKPTFARNVVTAFARIDGRPVGIVANNPRHLAGTFDTPASDKASRFISTCDAFGLPLVFLADVPGVLPGPDAERQGIARHSGKVIYEINRATVPIVSVVMRRAYGFGYVLMAGGRETDLSVAWPTAEISAMGIEGAVDIAYRREVEAADDPQAKREELVREFVGRTGAVRSVADLGVDAAIDPYETRDRITGALERARAEERDGWPPKKHSINPQ
ncbi:MAG: acyl-CoA carboxylase subunit beta [Haloarculaceae archaeon]